MNSDKAFPKTAILYQNDTHDITLIDLPTSISVAQESTDTLLSTPPGEVPYLITNDPKTPKSQARHGEYVGSSNLHTEYKVEIDKALTEIRAHVSGPWCLPRKLMTQVPKSGNAEMDIDDPEEELESRMGEWSTSKGDEEPFDLVKMMAALGTSAEANATSSDPVAQGWRVSYRAARERTDEAHEEDTVPPDEPWMSSFHNPHDYALDLTISGSSSQSRGRLQMYQFRIPPRCTFFFNDANEPGEFRASFRDLTSEYNLPRHFDFVLLDPPWPSGSVKRKGAYDQFGGMPHMKRMLLRMDIDSYLEHNGILGIWVTNSTKLREVVLGPGGLFEKWNVSFFEEWIWIKTTAFGEATFRIDTLWRKPYEALLLARAAPNSWTKMEAAPNIKRRVIAAVPDMHSRKPCLKELIEPYMPDRNDYNALEVFSRHLVAGWTSWGNEVLKFNWDRYWASNTEDA